MRMVGTAWLCLLVLLPALAWADAGVLTPYSGSQEVTSDALVFQRLEIRLRVDHGMARVQMLHRYRSQDDRLLEGRYTMVLPELADIDGFAVWDDITRIPGVIVEKAEARRLFEEIVRQQIDPGLLTTEDEPSIVNEFTARVAPIAPFGGKRLEMGFGWPTPIERGRLDVVLPLRADGGATQVVEKLVIDIEFVDDLPLTDLAFHGADLVPEITSRDEHGFVAHYEAANVTLNEDLSFTAAFEMPDTTLSLVAFRDIEHVDWSISPSGGGHFRDEHGYFAARVLFPPRESKVVGNRHVLFVADGSLSMLGDKLDRTVEMLGYLTRELAPGDQVNLLFTNTLTVASAGDWRPVSAGVAADLDRFLREQEMAGGLDLAAALIQAGKLLPPDGENVVILLSDGHPTAGVLRYGEIVTAVQNSPLVKANARLFAVGIGNDANRTLLTDLARVADGHYTWCPSLTDTQDLAETVAARLSAMVMRNIEITFDRADNVLDIYPAAPPATFAGSETAVVGRFDQPGADTVTVRYQPEDAPLVEKRFAVELPTSDPTHPEVRRRWAKARIDYLLDLIRREGETRQWVDEIIALAKRFTFVTPYTSFLAAPRALLRPRVIRPGDPLLRVRTDQAAAGVTAVFPFGLVAPLTYLPDEDVWQVRFLAPLDFADGAYRCELVITDNDQRQFVEPHEFVLDGKAPTVTATMQRRLTAGKRVRVAVYADNDTRHLSARLPFTASVPLRWDDAAKASVGFLDLPAGAPPGPAQLEVYAEDFAHNVSRTLIDVEVAHD